MSAGLIALFDDVALIAKAAAASVDDVAAHAAKAASKSAGVVIDDAAVTPGYVVGFAPERELPVIWRIARGSLFNKIVILLPAALLLSAVAPWAITPLLLAGGLFLAFEGAEKVLESLSGEKHVATPAQVATQGAAAFENARVKSAVRTDFILSAEIMAIALSTVTTAPLLTQAIVLAVTAVLITAGVYGAVAVIVKADDVGLRLAGDPENSQAKRALGRKIVAAMPSVLRWLTRIGTAAMLWVGGGIIVHSAAHYGLAGYEHAVHAAAHAAGDGLAGFAVEATAFALVGLLVGFLVVKIVETVRPHGAH